MKVQDVMTEDVVFCSPNDNLARAAALMFERDCGVIPIVDEDKRIVGIVTDRDICIAAAIRNAKPSEIKAADFVAEKVVSCRPEDKIKDALKKMEANQLKRLVVTSQDGCLVGIISIADILSATDKRKSLAKKAFSTLKSICQPHPITLREI